MTLPAYQAIGTAVSAFALTAPDDVLTMACSWPTHAAGDIGLFCVYDDGSAIGAEIDPADGWALVDTAASSTARLKVFWKRAASGAEGAASFTTSGGLPTGGAAANAHGVIITYRGCVASGNPINTNANATRTTSTSCTFPTITTSLADAMIVLVGSRDDDNAAAAWSAQTNAALGSITERYDAGTTAGNGGGLSITEGTKVAAGAVGTTSSTVTSSAGGMITLALRGILPSSSNFFFST